MIITYLILKTVVPIFNSKMCCVISLDLDFERAGAMISLIDFFTVWHFFGQ